MNLEFVDSMPDPANSRAKAPAKQLRCMICNKPLHGNLRLTCGKPDCINGLFNLTRGSLDDAEKVIKRSGFAYEVKHLMGASWVSDGTTGNIDDAEKAAVKLSSRSPETRYRIYRLEDGKFVEFREGKPW
jgi:hypothetical protein